MVADPRTLIRDLKQLNPSAIDQAKVWLVADDINSNDGTKINLPDVRKVTVESGITASATQSQGEQLLTKEVSIVETVTVANDVVTLPIAVAGLIAKVVNRGAKTLQVFPASNNDIDGGALNASVTIAPGTSVTYHAVDGTSWYS